MIYVSDVRDDICGYAIDIKHNKDDERAITLYFQSRKNAELIKYAIEIDDAGGVVAGIDSVKEGEWLIRYGDDGFEHHYCSLCDNNASFEYNYEPIWDENYDGEIVECGDMCTGIHEDITPFCPMCGTKMKKRENEKEE